MLTAEPLALVAFDEDDLAVISTHLQDAAARPADMIFLPRERRFALVVDRFDWCGAQCGQPKWRRAGLHFERVLAVRRSHFEQSSGAPSTLLLISFAPTDPPAGAVTLHFEGGSAIRLEVECLEAAMKDLGPTWPAAAVPAHQA
jgi:hypothetical protein